MAVNVWSSVGAVTTALPLTTLLGLTGQLLGMNAAATLGEWKAVTFLANQLAVPVGSAAAPSYTFTGSLNSGWYEDNILNAMCLSVSGARRFRASDLLAAFQVPLAMEGKLFIEDKSVDIIAAANIDLGTATGNYVYITNAAGNINITRLGGNVSLPAGTKIEMKFVILGGTVTLIHDPNFLNLPGAVDISLANGDFAEVRKTNDADQFWEVTRFGRSSLATAAGAPNSADLVTFIQPDINDRPAMVAGGWLPWNLNQQWGGSGCMPFHMVDSATGAEFKFDAFDGYLDDDGVTTAVGNVAGQYYQSQVITPAKNLSVQAFWLKLFKTLNPVDNVTVQLWSYAAGVPGALVATANVINGKQITSDTGGQWYRFSFAAVQALVAGTQYFIVISKSAGVDAANFYTFKGKLNTKYPSNRRATGTIAPVWASADTFTIDFLCEAQASDQAIQSAGQFTGRIVGSGTGNPVNRSTGYCKLLREFFPLFCKDGWSVLLRGKSWTKDRTIVELMYGLHHDRINIRSATGTGFVTATLYEADGTVNTVAGTSDVSGAAYKDILIVGRTMGDGADYLKIYTGIGGNWVKEAEATAQDYDLDPLMRLQGTAWIMGGFQLHSSANYTDLQTMAALPSAGGWVFTTTTATVEGNVFAVSGGKLNQIKAGMAAGGDGFYKKAALGLVNATGASSIAKARIVSATNTKNVVSGQLQHIDGTRLWNLNITEYYLDPSDGAAFWQYQPQIDFKSAENVIIQTGKGNDGLIFVNGKLVIDGTAKNITASALNQAQFGDQDVGANENADVVWDYVGYVNTPILPQFTAGELSEFAVWSGDKNVLGQALYNAGVPLSIKQYCGLEKNYVLEQCKQYYGMRGITANPTATTPDAIEAELEHFMLGTHLSSIMSGAVGESNAGGVINKAIYVDGASSFSRIAQPQTATEVIEMAVLLPYLTLNFGLHKIESRMSVSVGTVTSNTTRRALNTEVRSV